MSPQENPKILHKDLELIRFSLGERLPSKGLIESYIPPIEFTVRNMDGEPHGWGHHIRVFILQELVAQNMAYKGKKIDHESLRWAAMLHDCQRINDEDDPDHGTRMADLLMSSHPFIKIPTVESVANLIQWHVPEDDLIPGDKNDLHLQILKDADSMEYVRSKNFDIRYLRLLDSKFVAYAGVSTGLWNISEMYSSHGMNSMNAAIQAGIDLGVVRNK